MATVVFLIPWLLIALVIKLQSPGPVIYKATRIGKDGRPFTLLKFRTMRVDSGRIRLTTLRNDPRVFPFGAFLRKTKLDETPQLLNILAGHMSVVGPRPEDQINSGKLYVGPFARILSAKPGLSSPASLYDYTHGETYPSEELYLRDFEPKKLAVELYYVDHQSFLYDLQIIFRTIATITLIAFGKRSFDPPRELALVEGTNA
ncbi:MAG: sugar transferase [Kiritimatiellae bacterium]|nr:sugar transferase [Kiritimatiellia bacterium]